MAQCCLAHAGADNNILTRRQDVVEKADRTAFSEIAVQNADDGYSRRGTFDGSLAHSMF